MDKDNSLGKAEALRLFEECMALPIGIPCARADEVFSLVVRSVTEKYGAEILTQSLPTEDWVRIVKEALSE